MSFRRLPFQFSSSDPAERQAELEKRFGLNTKRKMFVDVANPVSKGAGKASESYSSPRLQHRVPIFMEGSGQPIKSSVDSVGSNGDAKKPNVRVIPIEIEGDYRPSSRQRTFSGPAAVPKENDYLPLGGDFSPIKRSMQDLSQPSKPKVAMGPRVCNIPIKIDQDIQVKKPAKVAKPANLNKDHSKMNGCGLSKQLIEVKSEEETAEVEQMRVKKNIEISLKKIKDVLKEFASYESAVSKFTGTMKDKQYRYLDEMLTRCMLRLDDVDTMGNDTVRSARKSAVKQVQACIDLLDTKVNAVNSSEEQQEINPADVDMKEVSKTDEEEYSDQAPGVQMTKSQDSKSEVEVPSAEEKASANEVEMAENQSPAVQDDSIVPSKELEVEMADIKDEEVPSAEEKASANEVEMAENQSPAVQDDPIVPSKELEVEMADIKDEDSNTESADEVPEAEMSEGTAVESENMASVELQNVLKSDSSKCAELVSDKKLDADMEDVEKDSGDNELNKDAILVADTDSSIVNDVEVTKTDITNSSTFSELESDKKQDADMEDLTCAVEKDSGDNELNKDAILVTDTDSSIVNVLEIAKTGITISDSEKLSETELCAVAKSNEDIPESNIVNEL